MKKAAIFPVATMAALVVGALAPIAPVSAGMFDMMNPGRWFDDDDDRYYRYGRYGHGPYGYRGPYGYGPYGYGAPYGYGPYGGYGGPYGYPGYGAGNTIVVTPQSSGEKAAPRVPE